MQLPYAITGHFLKSGNVFSRKAQGRRLALSPLARAYVLAHLAWHAQRVSAVL